MFVYFWPVVCLQNKIDIYTPANPSQNSKTLLVFIFYFSQHRFFISLFYRFWTSTVCRPWWKCIVQWKSEFTKKLWKSSHRPESKIVLPRNFLFEKRNQDSSSSIMMIWRVFFKEKKEKRCPFLFFRDVLDLVFVVFCFWKKCSFKCYFI